jgi:capsular exopolysaccharide synthesis family protein
MDIEPGIHANDAALDGRSWSLRDQVEPIRRRWWVIAAAAVLGFVIAYAYSRALPRQYQGVASLVQISGGAGTLSFLPGLGGQEGGLLETQAEIIRSRTIIERAVERLGLTTGRVRAFQQIRTYLSVTRPRNTTVLRVATNGPTPETAANYANAVVDAFLDWHLESRRDQAGAGRKFIEDQLEKLTVELRGAEERLAGYKIRTGRVDVSSQAAAAIGAVASFQSQLTVAGIERRSLETTLTQTRAQLGQQAPTVTRPTVTVQEDPRLQPLRTQLIGLEIELATLLQQFTDEHPRVVATRARIEETKNQMQRLSTIQAAVQVRELNPMRQQLTNNIIQMQIEREALLAKEAALGTLLVRSERALRQIPVSELDIVRLTRAQQVAEGTFLLLSQKLQEARIAEASVVSDFRIVDRARARGSPVAPRVGLNSLLGALAGLVLGLGLVYLGEALDTTFRTPQEAAAALGLPLLAAVPFAGRTKGGELILAGTGRRDPFAEAFRHLRTNLLYLDPDRPLRSLLVTSPAPGEGKSTVSANLAVAMTQIDRKVWLLECDLRRPVQKWVFQPTQPYGLTDLLVDGLPVDAALNTTQVENLWFISSGTVPPNPAELLGSHRMQTFLEEGRDRVQLMVLDAPPVLPVTDATVLSRSVDGVVLVIHLQKTPRDAALRTLEQLRGVGARIAGLVVNFVPVGRSGYGYYYYYYSRREDDAGAASDGPKTDAPASRWHGLGDRLRGRRR